MEDVKLLHEMFPGNCIRQLVAPRTPLSLKQLCLKKVYNTIENSNNLDILCYEDLLLPLQLSNNLMRMQPEKVEVAYLALRSVDPSNSEYDIEE